MTAKRKKILGRIMRYYIVPFTLCAAILFPTANMHQSINGLASILTNIPFMRGDLDFLGWFAVIPGFLAFFLPAGFAYLKLPVTFGLMEEMLIFWLYVWCAIVRSPRIPDFIQRRFRGEDYSSPEEPYPNRFPFWFIGSIALVIVLWGQSNA